MTAAAGSRRRRIVRGVLGLAVVVALVVSVSGQWDQVRGRLDDVSAATLAGSLVLTVVGLGFSMLSWRAVLAGLGSPLPVAAAARVFFLSQLGKYLPGSVWPVVAQMELGRDHDVPRSRMAAAGVVAMGFGVAAAVLLGAAVVPFGVADAGSVRWLALAVPAVLLLLHPALLSRLLGTTLRLLRRAPLERPLDAATVVRGLGYAVLTWVCTGLHVWLVARDLGGGGDRLLPLAVGGFALAWAAGFLVVIAPAGAGVREGALVVALSGSLGRPAAVALALISRLVLTAADVVVAVVVVVRRRVGGSAAAQEV